VPEDFFEELTKGPPQQDASHDIAGDPGGSGSQSTPAVPATTAAASDAAKFLKDFAARPLKSIRINEKHQIPKGASSDAAGEIPTPAEPPEPKDQPNGAGSPSVASEGSHVGGGPPLAPMGVRSSLAGREPL
ncbi:hypothetical protein AK812_SmicGene44492, partial [Symbiodinium microadriaticum]